MLQNILNCLEPSFPGRYSGFYFVPLVVVQVSLAAGFDYYFFIDLINSGVNDVVVDSFDCPFFNVVSRNLQKRNELAEFENFT